MSKLAGYKVEDIVTGSFVYGMKSVFIVLLIFSLIAFIISNIDRKINHY